VRQLDPRRRPSHAVYISAGAALAAVAVALQVDVLRRGVQGAGDTSRYTDGAAQILNGDLLHGTQWLYGGYIAFVAAITGLGLGLQGVVVAQILLLFVAALALADLARRLSGPVASLAAAFLWLTTVDFTRYLGWQTYILTESAYASAVVIVLWSVHRALEDRGPWNIAAAASLGMAASLRPNGWLLFPVVAAYLTATRWRSVWGWILAAALFGLTVAGAELVPGGQTVRGDTAQQLAEGRVFYGPWQLRMPDRQPEQGVVGYITSHPLSVARLVVARMAAEAAHIRPGYSDRRNIVFGVWAGTIWLLALPGMWFWRDESFTWLAVGVIAAQFGLVAVTFADIEGRFLIHVVGPIALCGGLAVGRLAGEREPPSHSQSSALADDDGTRLK
jgi:dolichyl-phosphate-mannose-protein mannosyltransferase